MGRRNLKRERLIASRLDTAFSSLSKAGSDSGSSTSGRGWLTMQSSHSWLVSRQILAVIGSRHSQRPGELQFCHIVAIQAGNVLIIRARQRLLSLHDFNAIGHPGGESLLRAREIFIGKIHVLARDCYLLRSGLQTEKRGADVIIDLSAQVFCFGLALPKHSFRLSDIAFNASTSENRHAEPRLKSEGAMQAAKVGPLHSIVAAGGEHRITLGATR